MSRRYGRDMGYTSHEVKMIFRSLRLGENTYKKTNELCKTPGCRNGFRINTLNNSKDECPTCKGYGFYRKV